MENSTNNHLVKIIDRKNIILNGVKKIVTFDSKQFLIDSNMGSIIIKGSNLEVVKLDTIDGTLSIKGNVDSFIYVNSNNKESFITKLFK